MPVLKLNDQQFTLGQGATSVGGGAGADVRIGPDEALGVQAIVDVSEGGVVIRRATPAAAVKVNGVPLGIEPTPLMHGDKVEVAGRELQYAEDAKAGATQFVSAKDIAAIAQKRAGPARATAATGGRLVSLVDGKEYTIPASGITVGRDAGAGVVVPQSEVSRLHAAIVPGESGYLIKDHSSNGTFVNGQAVQGQQVLARADVIRIGTEEFRFYADVAPAAKATPVMSSPPVQQPPAPAASAPSSATVPPKAATPAPPAAAAPPPIPPARAPSPPPAVRPAGVPATPPAAAPPAAPVPRAWRLAAAASPPPPVESRPVLAELEVTGEAAGTPKGTKFELHLPLAHVGRGTFNDVVIPDDSVSDVHAKLQRRDDGWYVVDVGSTNGTYVGGARITTEQRLEGSPDLRFGGVKMRFRAEEVGTELTKGTRAIAAIPDPQRPQPAARPASVAAAATTAPGPATKPPVRPAAPAPPAPAKSGGSSPAIWIVLILVIVAAAGAGYFFLAR